MRASKFFVSIDNRLLRRLDSLVQQEVFRSRSEAIEKAVAEKLGRMDRSRLARECAKLSISEEQEMAEEGLAKDAKEWPDYQRTVPECLALPFQGWSDILPTQGVALGWLISHLWCYGAERLESA